MATKQSATKRLEADVWRILLAMQAERLLNRAPDRQYRFCTVRRFAFDFAWPELRLAVEIQGGTYGGANAGRHGRGYGIDQDYAKANHAAQHGWRLLYVSSPMLRGRQRDETFSVILRAAQGAPCRA